MQKTVLIVNNGKNERATNFSVTDTFACPKTLTLGDSNGMVTLKLYSIAVYNRALTVDEAFNSWVLSTSDMATIIQRNDIYADGTNTVSPDKVVSRVPVLLITGDMPKLIEANDKKTNIHADVEFRNNQDPSKNFTATGMKFYRQGTSSLSYKIPNLNGELDDQSVMYDYEGKEITAYSFKDKAQPVRLWCFKADVAESSGSHNVGIARLWNKVMYNTKLDTKYLQEGEDQYVLRTNAQRAAIQANYPYDVRTTIDGFPIVVFYRLNKNSEWVCMGQYNFNNDKKTESVFGFKDIPGFDNTNVECWEGLNNTEPIGLYTDISEFDTKWDKAFEARYPDGSTKVNNLKTFATWVNSTKDDINKFSTEKYQHLDVWKVAAYYVYLMRFGAVDQPVKNSMTTTEDGQHYFFINYDNDTINGKRNDGPLVYGPFIDRQTIDEEIGEYAYAGHDSVLWNNLEADQDFMNKVAIIDNAMYAAGLSYSGVIEEFDTNQVDKWCEKLGNINGDYKYLKPFREENNAQYLPMLQGDLKSHRHWWLSNRFEMFDAMWVSGNYKSKAIVIKAVGNTQDKGFTLTAGKDLRYGYGINNDPIQYNIPLNFGDNHRFTFTRNLGIGDPIRIYAANCVQKLQLGEMTDILVEVNMSDAVDTLLGSKIKGIYLGSTVDDSIVNNAVDGINGLTQLIGLEELDIRGFKGIKTLELTTLNNLHKFWAAGSGLNSFIPAVGANLDYVTLPTTIQALRLDKTNINSIVYTPNTTLREVVMKNVTGMDVKSFVLGWHNSLSSAETDLLSTASLTLEGINWTGMTAADVLKLADFGYHSLKGKVTLTSLNQEEMNLLTETFGSNVFQSTGEFIIDAPASVFLTGPTTVLSGETAYYKAVVFPVTEGAEFKYQMVGVSSTTDSEGNIIYKSGTTILYESTGKLVTVESASSSSFTLRARLSGSSTYLDSKISVTGRTYPSSVELVGDTFIKTTGEKEIVAEYNVKNFTGSVKSISWSLDCDASIAEVGENNSLGCKILVNSVPDGFIEAIVTLHITFSNESSLSQTVKLLIGKTAPIMTSESNPEVMRIMYKAGLAANADYMTEEEANMVLSEDLCSGVQNDSIFYKYRSNTNEITFNEFKYFTNVQKIPSYTFYNIRVTELIIPSSVTLIEASAFERTALGKIVIPDTVQIIEDGAFYYAWNDSYRMDLTITNPNISCGRFMFCYFSNINVPNEILKEGLFYNCSFYYDMTIKYAVPKLFAACEFHKKVTVDLETCDCFSDPYSSGKHFYDVVEFTDKVKTIQGNYCSFAYTKDVIFGSNVVTISNAFMNLYKNTTAKELVLPDSLITLDDSVINANVSKIVIPKNCEITNRAPYNSNGSLLFEVDEENPYYCSTNEGLYDKDKTTLYRATVLSSEYTISENINRIIRNAFYGGTLTHLNIALTSDELAFEREAICSSALIEVNMGNSNINKIYLEEVLVQNNSVLKSVILPPTLQYLEGSSNSGALLFSGKSLIASMTIPDSLKKIKGCLFYSGCYIEELTFPTSIDIECYSGFFSNWTALKKVNFENCNIVLHTIQYYFNGCSSLESIVLNDSITNIGSSAFDGCKALKAIRVNSEVAPTVNQSTFGTSTSNYTGRNTYNTGENKLYIPQGATGYDTSYWLDPLQNAEECGFSIEYLPDPDLEIGSWITIDQTITDPATMITGDVNGEHIQLIRNNSHRYLGKYTAEGTMTLCQLDDNDSTKYADGTTADLSGAEGDVFMKMPRFWYIAKEKSTDVWGIGFYYGTESPGENWKEWSGNELIGVYEAYSTNSKVYSRSDVESSGSISQANFKAYARNRGNGFQIVDWQMHCIMGILYYAQYGHTNCQEKIGAGTDSDSKQCGQTNANGMNDTKGTSPVSGLNDAGADGNSQSINFWGLENWWGNKNEWIDNVVVDPLWWKITEPDGTVRTLNFDWGPTNAWIGKLMFGDNCDLIPTGTSGSETTGFCDYRYGSAQTDRVVKRSNYNASSNGGVASVAATSDSSSTHSVFGSRLAFRGQCVEAESVATFKSLTAIG